MSDIVNKLYEKIDEGRSGRNIGLKTGLPKLDWYTGGYQKGVYKLIFGTSGSGKSSYAIYSDLYRILKDYPEKDIKHVYFSLEMGSNVLLAKLLNLYLFDTYGLEISYLTLLSVREPLPEDIYQKVLEAKQWLESIKDKLIIFDKQLSADSFYAAMMTLLEKWGTFSKTADGRRTIYTPHNSEQIVTVFIDHAGLLSPAKGRDKKQEIDLCSQYCVRFRELCDVSIDFIMQENRNAGSMDRRKAELSESTLDDAKDSGNPINDCSVCIAVYNPIKYQLKSYRGYKVIDDIGPSLGSAIRGLILLKHRFGTANKVFCVGFQGSIGRFEELPKPEVIDYSLYQSWKEEKQEDTTVKEVTEEKDSKKSIYTF